jgi:TonB-dependent receptor
MFTISRFLKKVVFLVFFGVLPFFVNGQNGNAISGKVIDNQTGEPLPGASVVILNTSIGTTTELNGEFEISNIKENSIILSITFVGYESATIEHDFTKIKKGSYSIKLKPSAMELEQVKVEAESDGQVKAFIQQKEAANIKNIISAKQIEQFPDMNAAEAMQRIPGITLQRDQGEGRFVQLRGTPPELTSFNINGEQIPSPEGGVRYVGMDVISADQIDFIEITKMLTPDMDADAIAGTVNIITKRAKSTTPEINATIAGGYSHLRGTENYNLQFSYGQRYGKFGLFLNGSYYANNYGSDNMEFKYVKSAIWTNQGQEEDNYVVRYRDFQLRHYDITRKRTGFSATMDYQFRDNSYIYLRGMFNSFSDDEIRRRKVYTLDDPLTENYFLYGGIEHDVKDRVKLQGLNTINFGGDHEMGIFRINYDIAYAVATENTPRRIFGRFENPGQAVAIKFDYTDPDYPKPYFPKEEDLEVALNYQEYEFDRLSIRQEKVSDNNIAAKLDLQTTYLENQDQRGIIKVGGKVRFKRKEQDINAMVLGSYNTTNPLYPGEAPELTLPFASDGFTDNNLLNKGYVLEYIPYSENLDRHYEFYPWFFIMSRDNIREETIMQDYYAEEDIYAAYLMLQHDFKKLMVLAGLRYEKTDIYYEGRRAIYHPVTNKFIDADTIPDNRSQDFLIPYLQLKYSLKENLNLRAGFTYTFARPNFEDVIPSYEGNEDGDFHLGNPDLKFPRSLNIDVAVEKYIQGDGIIAAGLFYKEIENFVSKYSTHAHFDSLYETSGFIYTSINGIKSNVYGLELQSQFKFNFLPGFFKDFGIYVNYTYTHSEATIPRRKPANYTDFVFDPTLPYESQFTGDGIENITLPGQAKHAANFALFFDNKKFYAKVSANFHDTFLYELGADKDLDVYYNEALHLDFTSHYVINKHLRIFTDVVNLTNQPLIFYLDTPDQVKKKEFYSWTARLGLKLNF